MRTRTSANDPKQTFLEWRVSLVGEFPEDEFERDPAGAVLRATPFEIDPTLVEAATGAQRPKNT